MPCSATPLRRPGPISPSSPLSTSPILPLPPIASFLSPHRSMSPLPHGFISPLPRFPPLLAPYFTLSTLPPWIYFNPAPPPSSFNSVHMDLFHPSLSSFIPAPLHFFQPCQNFPLPSSHLALFYPYPHRFLSPLPHRFLLLTLPPFLSFTPAPCSAGRSRF